MLPLFSYVGVVCVKSEQCGFIFVFSSVLGNTGNQSQRAWNQTGIGMCSPSLTYEPVVYIHVTSSVTVLLFQERVRTYMNRVKEITDKKKAGRLDKQAAARFVRSALYDKDDKDARKKAEGSASEAPPSKRAKKK